MVLGHRLDSISEFFPNLIDSVILPLLLEGIKQNPLLLEFFTLAPEGRHVFFFSCLQGHFQAHRKEELLSPAHGNLRACGVPIKLPRQSWLIQPKIWDVLSKRERDTECLSVLRMDCVTIAPSLQFLPIFKSGLITTATAS